MQRVSARIEIAKIREESCLHKETSRIETAFLLTPRIFLLLFLHLLDTLLYPPRSCLPFARSCAIYEANRFTLFARHGSAKNVHFCDIYRLGT